MYGLSFVTDWFARCFWHDKPSKEEQIVSLIDKFLSEELILNVHKSGNEVFTDSQIRKKYHDSVEKLQVFFSQVFSQVDKTLLRMG